MGAEPARRPLLDAAARRTLDAEHRVRGALRELDRQGAAITFAGVAQRAQVSRAFLYQHAKLRAEIEACTRPMPRPRRSCRPASAPATRRYAPGCARRLMRASASARRSLGCARSWRWRTGARGTGARPSRPPRVSALAPSSARPPQSQSVLEAVLERITYANEDTGYTIARVATERTGPDLLTVVGPLLGAQVGESLRLTGRWSSHPKYGKQFQVDSFTTVLPATIQGIRRYLGSGLIKGIGPMMAERMVAHFGTEILTIIEEQPGRLIEVHGLGPKRTRRIADAWEEQKAIKEVMVFLSGIGVSTSLAVRIYKAYADDSISVVRSEPYRLASKVRASASRPLTRSPRRSGSARQP